MRHALLVFGIAAACIACGGEKPDAAVADSPARRRIDSAIGASALPGAASVSRAMNAADSAAASARRLDSAGKSP